MKKHSKQLSLIIIGLLVPITTFAANGDGWYITIFEQVKTKFVEGGVSFMSIVGVCLIFGLAISIERIITLNLASINLSKFLTELREKLVDGGVEEARQYCDAKSGPIPNIVSQSLLRYDRGVGEMEKSIIGYGQVEMGKLEKGLSWIALFIALAPMFGFMGTVLGMIESFEDIQKTGEIIIGSVAEGIKKALLTTVAGLVVAVILQFFYNYCTSKLESIVNQMEEAALIFIDMLVVEDLDKKA